MDPFGGYPYLITRIGHTDLRHITLLPADWPRARLAELARRQRDANQLDTCLALGETEAMYFDANVVDGFDSGRPASMSDIDRLAGAGPDRIPPGLARCPTCNKLAGEYLALNGEGSGDLTPRVIDVHCRCANHNRCAACGAPLAASRLSAYRYDVADRKVWYLAAYAGLSHKCAVMPA